MSDYTKVHFGTMEQGQANFSLAYRGLRDTLDDLEKDLESGLSEWVGSAQGAYWDSKRKWDKATADVAHVLNRLGVVIGDAHQNYSAAEKANTGIWNGGA